MTNITTPPPACSVIELRQYTLRPGQRDTLVELFEREFIETQAAVGLHVLGIFRDAEREDRFVWLRGFADMDSRRQGLEAFYGGPVWRAHREAANATMIDSDDVHLLRPLSPWPAPGGDGTQPWHLWLAEMASPIDDGLRAALRSDHGNTWLETEPTPNDFPRLPVHTGVNAVVGLARGSAVVPPPALRERLSAPPLRLTLIPTRRSVLR